MLSRKRQERKMMMKTAKTLGFAGSVPVVFPVVFFAHDIKAIRHLYSLIKS